MIRTGGRTFNPNEDRVYFLASSSGTLDLVTDCYDHLLIAVNELKSDSNTTILEGWLDAGKRVFIDSGIFNLTNEHAKANNVSMNDALALAPEDIDGFDELWTRYVHIAKKYGERSWGYIELDQGGRENKIRTRAKLEGLGLRPIPVYHPLNDGWDYFDHLAENYDRICFGNIVQADAETRKRLVATMWERHRKYPHLWIHLLGMTPGPLLIGFPSNSADSSSWLTGIRWSSGNNEFSCLRRIGDLPQDFRYKLGSEPASPEGRDKYTRFAAYQYRMHMNNWREALGEYARLGCVIYPGPTV